LLFLFLFPCGWSVLYTHTYTYTHTYIRSRLPIPYTVLSTPFATTSVPWKETLAKNQVHVRPVSCLPIGSFYSLQRKKKKEMLRGTYTLTDTPDSM